jgi:hypothetical protein
MKKFNQIRISESTNVNNKISSRGPSRERKLKWKEIKHKRTKIVLLVISILLIVLVSLGLFSINPAISTYYSAMRAKEGILQAQKAFERINFTAAATALKYANEDLISSQKSLSKLRWVKIVPFINIQFNAADHLLSAGIQISSSLKTVSETAVNIIAPIDYKKTKNLGEITVEQKREILKNLYESTPSLERAKSEFELAEIEIKKMPRFGVISQIEDAKNQITNQLPQVKQALEKGVVLSKLLPGILGHPNEQVYFFLFQNNTELRPTGGFLGTYGVLKVQDGEIKELTTDDTYNLDNRAKTKITPPWQFPKLVHPALTTWYLRDANWSPDFPTSAENAVSIYHKQGGTEKEFNGVMAITPTLIEYLFEVTGPIRVSGFPKEFNSDNVVDLIQYQVEKRFAELGIKEEFRKEIIGELADVLIKKIFELPKEKLAPLALTLLKLFNEKHVLIYSNNEEMQKFIEEEGWAGKVEETSGDYLASIDANMASLKTDKYVDRSLAYEINLDSNDKAKAKLSITYKNNAPGFSWKTTRYRTWNRIYVPLGSELINISGNEKGAQYYDKPGKTYEIGEELGKASIGTFASIEPGEEKTLTYEYYLPTDLTSKLKSEGYKLLVQKQPGTLEPKLHVNLFSFNTIVSFSPAELGALLENNKKIEFKTTLLTDCEFSANFK